MSEPFKSPVICPKCNAIRKPDATVPDWQCPNCGIAYVKAGAANSHESAHEAKVVYQTSALPARRGTLKFLLCTFGVFAGGVWALRRQKPASSGEGVARKPAGPREVIMFATSWCGYCAAARRFFADNSIAFVEYDIERDAEGGRKYEKMGFKGSGVPIILIDGEVYHGFNEAALREALI